jgi:mono/diheme cytochrome c family protein
MPAANAGVAGKESMRSLVHPLAVTLMLAAAASLGAQEPPPPEPGARGGRGAAIRDFLGLGAAPDAAAAERGGKLYQPNCAFCHGERATGADGPDLVRSTVVLHDEKGDLIGPVLLKGRADKGMPAFSTLTEGQLRDIAEFLHLKVELAANRGTYHTLNVVTGDAKKGEAYFNGAGGCNACHSPTGDLAHVASRYPPEVLQNRFLWPGGFGSGVRRVTVTLPDGETFSGTPKRLDDFTVSLTDASGNYHSWQRSNGVQVALEDRLAAHRQLLGKYTDADIHNLTAYLVTLR